MTKHAILLFSHGSVLCGAEQNLLEITTRLRARTGLPVEAAFLNYSAPDFDVAVDRLVAAGATAIDIAPYFLVAGKFVTENLPQRIDAARLNHPTVNFRVAAPIGFHEALADAVASSAGRAEAISRWRDTELQAARFCRDSPKCPLHGSTSCPATAGGANSPPPSAPTKPPLASPDEQRALLVLAHGSPRAEANEDIRQVVELLRQRTASPDVHLGYLDVNTPDIPTAIDELVDRGAQSIVAVPYFLHTGKHVTRDVPDLLDAAMQRHPSLTITMGDYLGHDRAIDEVLIARIETLKMKC